VIRGGSSGEEIDIEGAPAYRASHPTNNRKQYPITIGILFTSTGFSFYVSMPGITDGPVLIHTEDRGTSHPAGGWVLAVNKWSDANTLGVYDFVVDGSQPFLSGVIVTGGKIVVANEADVVQIASLAVLNGEGFNLGLDGTVSVRFPTLDSATFWTPTQLAGRTETLTGELEYPVDFKLSGDYALKHPVRCRVLDSDLEADEITGT
jgi:hypothetical protein